MNDMGVFIMILVALAVTFVIIFIIYQPPSAGSAYDKMLPVDACKSICEDNGGEYMLFHIGYKSENQCICKFDDGVRNIYG